MDIFLFIPFLILFALGTILVLTTSVYKQVFKLKDDIDEIKLEVKLAKGLRRVK